jgi:hypothetical protein
MTPHQYRSAAAGRDLRLPFLLLVLVLLLWAAVVNLRNPDISLWAPLAGAGLLVVAAIAFLRTPRGRRGRVSAGLGLVLTAVIALVWVVPIVRGPALVCVDTDPAICDEIWRGTFDTGGGLLPGTGIEQFFPVTEVRVLEGGCQLAIERVYLFTDASIC